MNYWETGRGGLKFNVDLRGNSCITSHRERRVRRRPPSAAVYNNLQPFTKSIEREKKRKREKEEERKWEPREGWRRGFGLMNRHWNQTCKRAKNYKTPDAVIRAVTKANIRSTWIHFLSPGVCVCVCVYQCDLQYLVPCVWVTCHPSTQTPVQ